MLKTYNMALTKIYQATLEGYYESVLVEIVQNTCSDALFSNIVLDVGEINIDFMEFKNPERLLRSLHKIAYQPDDQYEEKRYSGILEYVKEVVKYDKI